MIKKFITDIREENTYDENYNLITRIIFSGDGVGDFEEHSHVGVDKKVLLDYIDYCKHQIDLAERYFEECKSCNNCHCYHDEDGSNCQGSKNDICHEWREQK